MQKLIYSDECLVMICAWCDTQINENGIRGINVKIDKTKPFSSGICLVCAVKHFK